MDRAVSYWLFGTPIKESYKPMASYQNDLVFHSSLRGFKACFKVSGSKPVTRVETSYKGVTRVNGPDP